MAKFNYKHGDTSKSSPYWYLYFQYTGLVRRAKEHTASGDNCQVLFTDYLHFKQWALANGWVKGLHVCRNGDTGDYSPTNARIDTVVNNTIEAVAKHYTFISPDGTIMDVYNLRQFCTDNNLQDSNMSDVHSGKRKTHKKWKKG